MRDRLAALQALAARRRAAIGGDGGSMAVEFVFVIPVVLVMLLFLVFAGNIIAVHSEVNGAARDAVRAATLANTYPDAARAADLAVAQDVPACPVTDGSNPKLAGWPAGPVTTVTDLQVSLSCQLNMKVLGFGFGNVTVNAYAAAPLDTYVPRTAGQ